MAQSKTKNTKNEKPQKKLTGKERYVVVVKKPKFVKNLWKNPFARFAVIVAIFIGFNILIDSFTPSEKVSISKVVSLIQEGKVQDVEVSGDD